MDSSRLHFPPWRLFGIFISEREVPRCFCSGLFNQYDFSWFIFISIVVFKTFCGKLPQVVWVAHWQLLQYCPVPLVRHSEKKQTPVVISATDSLWLRSKIHAMLSSGGSHAGKNTQKLLMNTLKITGSVKEHESAAVPNWILRQPAVK